MKVEIEGKFYDLDVEAAKKFGVLTLPIYKIGQRFAYQDDDEYSDNYWILAQAKGGEVCLISLSGGNRFLDPIPVKDCELITEDEFYQITGGAASEFILQE